MTHKPSNVIDRQTELNHKGLESRLLKRALFSRESLRLDGSNEAPRCRSLDRKWRFLLPRRRLLCD